MALTQTIVLAVLQGISAVLPIGTAGHLSLVSALAGWPPPDPQFRLAIQLGVLLAVMAYFASDLWDMLAGVVRAVKGKPDPGARLALKLLVATVPAIGLGVVLQRYDRPEFHSMTVVAWTTIIYGLLLLLFDRMSMTVKRVEHVTYLDAVLVGVCQVLALIPGTSRAGVTMTMARFLGYERAEAARLSLILSIPILLAAIGIGVFRVANDGTASITSANVVALAVSFIAALLAVASLMAYLRRSTFTPFVIYRILLGGVVMALAYGWLQI